MKRVLGWAVMHAVLWVVRLRVMRALAADDAARHGAVRLSGTTSVR